MKTAARFFIALSLAACSASAAARQSNPITDLYAIPQPLAFAIAYQALATAARVDPQGVYRVVPKRGTHLGYELQYSALPGAAHYTQILYVVPASGVDAGGRKIDGFYFELTGGGPNAGYVFLRAALQDNSLMANLKALLDANAQAAVPIANLQQRSYEDGNGRLAQGMSSVLVKSSSRQ